MPNDKLLHVWNSYLRCPVMPYFFFLWNKWLWFTRKKYVFWADSIRNKGLHRWWKGGTEVNVKKLMKANMPSNVTAIQSWWHSKPSFHAMLNILHSIRFVNADQRNNFWHDGLCYWALTGSENIARRQWMGDTISACQRRYDFSFFRLTVETVCRENFVIVWTQSAIIMLCNTWLVFRCVLRCNSQGQRHKDIIKAGEFSRFR